MTTWREVLAVALAGTDRQELEDVAEELRGADPEETVLREAALLTYERLAGWQPAVGVVPDWERCPPETRPVASASAARLLDELLLSYEMPLIREWLELAASSGVLVAPGQLASLLQLARAESAVRQRLPAVVGERARWLAKLRPEWAIAGLKPPEEAWVSGTPEERLAALKALRGSEPDRARELLAERWASEPRRAGLLEALAVGLSAKDQAFLEQAVRDPRREVRQSARKLLARLPSSGFAQRMLERAQGCILWSSKRLEIEPPAGLDAGLQADELEPRPPSGMGERAWLLAQIVGYVPPSIWPGEMLLPVIQSDWARPVWWGLVSAAERFQDTAATELVLRHWEYAHELDKSLISPMQAFNALEPRAREGIAQGHLASPGLAAQLLPELRQAWSLGLSQAVAQRLETILEAAKSRSGAVLNAAAYHAHPDALPLFEQALAKHPLTDEAANRCLDILQFRAEMRKELASR